MKWIRKTPFTCMIIVTSLVVWYSVLIVHYVNTRNEMKKNGNAVVETQMTDRMEYVDSIEEEDKESISELEINNQPQNVIMDESVINQVDSVDVNDAEKVEEHNNPDDNQKEEIIGITRFEEYEPVEVNSKYYKDPGKRAFTTDYPYEKVDKHYFDDAAFIGDSRTVGIYDYSGIDTADFYCNDGYCTYLWSIGKSIYWQNERKKISLDEAMDEKQYGKIYVLLGMNDCGYGSGEAFKERYEKLLQMLQEKQPNAILYLVAILHVSKEEVQSQPIFNNLHIEDKNIIIAEFADGKNSFYLDYNNIFTNKDGYLNPELTFDGIHLYAASYEEIFEFFTNHAVVKQKEEN